MDFRSQLLSMLSRDGVSDSRKLEYTALLNKCENEAFINGRRYESDSKGSQLPGFHGNPEKLDSDIAHSEWLSQQSRERLDRMEEYNS